MLFGDATFGYYETICGGAGATPGRDGADAVHTHMTNTRLTDPEVLEQRYPVRVLEFAIRRGSGGAGRHRGGDGVIRRIQFLQQLDVSILSQRRGPYPPYGLSGGKPGALGTNVLHRAAGNPQALDAAVQFTAEPMDELRIETPGGLKSVPPGNRQAWGQAGLQFGFATRPRFLTLLARPCDNAAGNHTQRRLKPRHHRASRLAVPFPANHRNQNVERTMSDTPDAQPSKPSQSSPEASGRPRRNFLVEFASLVVGAVVGAVPLLLGVVAFFDPLARRRKVPIAHRDEGAAAGKEGFIPVASLAALAEGAAPQRFPVIADQIDAWNFSPDQPIGAVYLERLTGERVRAFHATCPHAGCSVSFSDSTGTFDCPCHNSSFNRDGTKRTAESGRENPSPRDLDELDVEIVDGRIMVKFVNFYTGKEEKKQKL